MTADHEHRPLRWGILGAARIAAKALIPAMRSAGAEPAAVGASSKAKAEAFARENGIDKAVEGYQAVLDDPSIEAVYIPLANGLHLEWAVKAAEAGKPCLCEKPMALTPEDAEAIAGAFEKAGLPLLEAFMWRHHAQADWLREELAAGLIGEPRIVNVNFSFTLDRPEDYRWRADQGGGALWDVGCYCLSAARLVFGGEPATVSARSILRGEVDETTAAWMDFGRGRVSSFTCSFNSAFGQGLEIIGEKARLWISKPWLPRDHAVRIHIDDGTENKRFREFAPCNSYEVMIRRFTAAVRTGDSARLAPGENGLAQARAMARLLASAAAGGAPK